MNVLVTGASGFVGAYLLQLLKEHGHEVTAIGLSVGELNGRFGVTAIEQDILNAEDLRYSFKHIHPEVVVHLAAISNVGLSWQNPALTVDVNIRGTLNVLEALRFANPTAKLINIGSSDEYGLSAQVGVPLTEEILCQPQSPYAITKYCAEQLCLQLANKYGIRLIQTRSFNHYGPGQGRGFVIPDFASQIVAMERGQVTPLLLVGNLEAYRDFTHVEDVVKAYVALVEHDVPSGVYNICSGKARKITDVLNQLLALAQIKIDIKRDVNRMRPSDVPYFVGNPQKIREATGWNAQYRFEQGLRDVLEYWRNCK